MHPLGQNSACVCVLTLERLIGSTMQQAAVTEVVVATGWAYQNTGQAGEQTQLQPSTAVER